MKAKPVPILLSLAMLAGCTPVDHGFGEALRWDIAQQVIDPDPEYAGEIMEGGSGQRANDAVGRYNKGEVKQPVAISSTTSGSSSSSGSGPK